MTSRNFHAALGAALLLVLASAAQADFESALKQYNAGQFDSAHAQFLKLAELGDCSAQFNLGAMALQGQGGPKDTGSGVGWLQAAAGNGCLQLVGNKLSGLQAKLSPEEQTAAAAIVTRYGHDALHSQGIVSPDFACREVSPATAAMTPTPEFPNNGSGIVDGAVVITEFTVGVDGHARDPQILLAVPDQGYPAAAVEAWLNAAFTPAQRAGLPVESRLQAKLVLLKHGVHSLADFSTLKSARERANAGDAEARYMYGLTATLDPSLGVTATGAGEMLLVSARDGDARAQYWVGSQLRATSLCHPSASGAIWMRHAAANGSAAAQLALARDLLGREPSAAQVSEARELLEHAAASQDYYVMKHVSALLASAPQEALRDPVTALQIARRLKAGQIQSDPQMFETVGAAFAAIGEFGHAAHEEGIAIRKAQSLGWDTRGMARRLAAYKSGQAWYGDLFAAT